MANRSITSTPTILRRTSWEMEQTFIETNQSQFDILLANLAPELFIIWQSIKLYHLNPDILPPIIKAIGDISYSTKLGEVIVEIRPDNITGEATIRRVRAVDTRYMDMSAFKK